MRLQPFSHLSTGQLATVVDLYRATFEAPWEWPWQDIAALANPGASVYWAQALLLDDAAAGFAIANHLPRSNFWYLHYFAVTPSLRSQGLGSQVLGATLAAGEAVARQAGHRGCRGTLVEVETVDGPPANADRRARERRHAFYERHRAIRTGLRYPRPPDAPPHMPEWDLLLIPGAAWEGSLDRPVRHDIVRAVCIEGYQMLPDTPYLIDYLASC